MKREKLWIIGAGGFGREVLSYARTIVTTSATPWDIGGFIDDNSHPFAGLDIGVEVRGPVSELQPRPDEVFFIAIGDPRTRLSLARALQTKGARFVTLIHPSANIGERVRIGEGCLIGPNFIATCDVTIGNFVALNASSGLGHDSVVGDGATLSGFAEITGRCVLGEGVFLGSHAVLTPGVRMGDYSKAYAGSVVMKDVAAGVEVGGNPARVVRAPSQAV